MQKFRCQHQYESLRPSQQGRGQTLHRIFSTPKICPLKPGRAGEFQPTVNSWSLLHCRWVTQKRRVDNYVKLVCKGNTTATTIEHRAALWRSICHANHCSGGFTRWWAEQVLHNCHMLPWLPEHPPELPIAEHIQDIVTTSVSHFQNQLTRHRI